MQTRTRGTILLLLIYVLIHGNPAQGQTGQSASKEPAVNLNAIPPGLSIEAQRVKLTRPVIRIIDGKRLSVREVIEFRVTAKGPFPVRALDPVLAVGSRLVTQYRYVRENELVFTEYEPEKLPTAVIVYFQWGKHPAPGARQATSMTFALDKLPVITREPNEKAE